MLASGKNPPTISVVMPVYLGAQHLHELHERLTLVLRSMNLQYELIFVDDRSPDNSWDLIKQLASNDSAVRGVRLSRNFGQHAAVAAGLSKSSGAWVVVMDADLQEPPEEIPTLFRAAMHGYDIVYSRKESLTRLPYWRALGRQTYFALFKILSGRDISEYGMLSMISRRVVNEYVRVREFHQRYLLTLMWLGFDSTTISYKPAQPKSSGYSAARLITLGLQNLMLESTTVRFLPIVLGVCGLLIAASTAALLLPAPHEVWAARTLVALQLAIGLLTLMALGAVIAYLQAILAAVRGRPSFVIRDDTAQPFEASPQETHAPEGEHTG